MNTQNVKTATKESSERWAEGQTALIVSMQKNLLSQLCNVWNLQLNENDEAEEIRIILGSMCRNVISGTKEWTRSAPRVSLRIVQPWLQARVHAVRLYGEVGRAEWECAREELVREWMNKRVMAGIKSD